MIPTPNRICESFASDMPIWRCISTAFANSASSSFPLSNFQFLIAEISSGAKTLGIWPRSLHFASNSVCRDFFWTVGRPRSSVDIHSMGCHVQGREWKVALHSNFSAPGQLGHGIQFCASARRGRLCDADAWLASVEDGGSSGPGSKLVEYRYRQPLLQSEICGAFWMSLFACSRRICT